MAKRAQSNARRYHKGYLEAKNHYRVWTEFVEETGYEDPDLPLKTTPEEQEELLRLQDACDGLRVTVDAMKERYGLTEEEIALLRDQYWDLSEPGIYEVDPITGDGMVCYH